jgi:hypothetical protein
VKANWHCEQRGATAFGRSEARLWLRGPKRHGNPPRGKRLLIGREIAASLRSSQRQLGFAPRSDSWDLRLAVTVGICTSQ